MHHWSSTSQNNNSSRPWRLGVEVETGGVASDPNMYYYNHHPHPATTINKKAVPHTKAVLPGEEEKTKTQQHV